MLRVYTSSAERNDPDELRVDWGDTFAGSIALGALRMRVCGADLANETDRQWLAFSASYQAEMRHSYRMHRAAWDDLLSRDRVVLVSSEIEAPRSIRTILAQHILPKLGAVYCGEI